MWDSKFMFKAAKFVVIFYTAIEIQYPIHVWIFNKPQSWCSNVISQTSKFIFRIMLTFLHMYICHWSQGFKISSSWPEKLNCYYIVTCRILYRVCYICSYYTYQTWPLCLLSHWLCSSLSWICVIFYHLLSFLSPTHYVFSNYENFLSEFGRKTNVYFALRGKNNVTPTSQIIQIFTRFSKHI